MAFHMVRVANLVEGDQINLEGDFYADRRADNPTFPYELARVDETKRETEGCIRVDTQLGSFGFPPDHEVPVERDAR
jgi:hypothetical protein